MTELFAAYDATRARMLDIARSAGPDALTTTVPSCPDWSALQLITHCVSMPAALGAGDFPSGDTGNWIDKILNDRAGRSLDELDAEWASANDTIAGMVNGGGAVLFDDLVVHEHDLRGALGVPDHSAIDASISVPRSLESCVAALETAGLGSIEVRSGSDVWRSHDAEPGWILEVSPWEAVRVLYSRRTADELRALGGSDNINDYIAVLDAHLPLPTSSLGES
ncbi:unannotated protein [freshwater metagenome]|uniref:Unannotated protein n=1 Tax=freshwater metagenome TaxID=449393 RepID=A0A6J6YAJ1_9ZZZZ|nr:hypothetical protein [Actinomycetota bacterium]